MNLEARIQAFALLGKKIQGLSSGEKEKLYEKATQLNPWFTPASIDLSFNGIAHLLNEKNLSAWASGYNLSTEKEKKVGVAMAGNIPLVGFHDYLCVLLSGNQLVAKLSSQDPFLLTEIHSWLIDIEPQFENKIHFEERLKNVDAIIATGSDNTARYFEYYFRNLPHIIRKNRSSCAILMGEESTDHLMEFGQDVFSYFGLGCRNVSKLYVPEGYAFDTLLKTWEPYKAIADHHKYANNYWYQKSIMLMDQIPFLDNGFVILTQKEQLVSPISVVYYETYKDQADLKQKLEIQKDKIQCMVSANGWFEGSVPFGKAQMPELWDYADGIDTMRFLGDEGFF